MDPNQPVTVELPDTLPHAEERAVIATLELIDESPALKYKLRLRAAQIACGPELLDLEIFNADLFATEVRKEVETTVAKLLASPISFPGYGGHIPNPIRRVVADWMVNISWARVATALYISYCQEGRHALPAPR